MITLHEFAVLVSQMRESQRRYVKLRSLPELEAAKYLELRVDTIVEDLLDPTLFDEPEDEE